MGCSMRRRGMGVAVGCAAMRCRGMGTVMGRAAARCRGMGGATMRCLVGVTCGGAAVGFAAMARAYYG
jgi:hypothetical protein